MNVDKKICQLIFDIYRRLRKNFISLTEGKLTIYQIHILLYLNEKKQVSLNDIAKIFGTSFPSATISVDKLVKEGMIKRKKSRKDRRITLIGLTKKGLKTINNLNKKRDIEVKTLLKKLSKKEKKTFLDLLEKIINS